jgi:hypothetical protein
VEAPHRGALRLPTSQHQLRLQRPVNRRAMAGRVKKAAVVVVLLPLLLRRRWRNFAQLRSDEDRVARRRTLLHGVWLPALHVPCAARWMLYAARWLVFDDDAPGSLQHILHALEIVLLGGCQIVRECYVGN